MVQDHSEIGRRTLKRPKPCIDGIPWGVSRVSLSRSGVGHKARSMPGAPSGVDARAEPMVMNGEQLAELLQISPRIIEG